PMRIFIFFIFFAITQFSLGQKSMLNDKDIHEVIKRGLDKTYNFEFDKAKDYYEQVKSKYPDHPGYAFLMGNNLYWEMLYYDIYFSTRVYDYFVIQYPETHPVYKPFMFFFAKGDKKRGITELEFCVENGIFSGIESLHYLANIFLKYENDPAKALTYSEQLV